MKHLADELKDLKLDEKDMFVSHDVVSLFTNTPIPQSNEIIKNRLQKDKSLKKRTQLTPDDTVRGAVKLCSHRNILCVQRISVPTEIWYSHG